MARVLSTGIAKAKTQRQAHTTGCPCGYIEVRQQLRQAPSCYASDVQVLSSRVIIHPVDLDISRRFYEEVLGLSVYREWRVGLAFFLGGGFLELSAGSTHGGSTLWLQVPTLTGVEEQLATGGVAIRKPTEKMPWGLVELWVEDPDGNELRFVEVPEDHPLRRR